MLTLLNKFICLKNQYLKNGVPLTTIKRVQGALKMGGRFKSPHRYRLIIIMDVSVYFSVTYFKQSMNKDCNLCSIFLQIAKLSASDETIFGDRAQHCIYLLLSIISNDVNVNVQYTFFSIIKLTNGKKYFYLSRL